MTAMLPLLAVTMFAQLPPPLAHALDAAREHNRALGISRAQLDQQRAAVDQALAALLPTLRTGGGYTRNEYEAVVSLPANLLGGGPPTELKTLTLQPYNAWTASVGLQIPLFSAANLYRYQESKRGEQGADQAVRATDAEVMLSTARAYYRVVGGQGVLEAAQRALVTAADNLQVTRVKYGAGTQTRLALDRAQVDVARAEQTRVSAHQALLLAVRSLETLTGEAWGSPLPAPPDTTSTARTEAELVEAARRARPEIQQAEAAVAQAELAAGEAWSALVPGVSGNATEYFTNATGFTGQSAYWAAGLSLTWNVDPAGTRAAVARSRAALEEQRQRLKQVEDTVRDDVHSAWLDVDSGAARVSQAKSEAESATDALGLTQQQYAAGTATSLDLSQAQRDAFNAEATFAQARADLAASELALAKAAGETFWLSTGGSP